MIPILFEHDETKFTNVTTESNPGSAHTFRKGSCKPYHGIGDLTDAISCVIKYSADDCSYELEMEYPISGKLFNELKVNRIILALSPIFNNIEPTINNFTIVKPNPDNQHIDPYQAFRIYAYEKNINGTITIKAQHLSYDLAHIYVFWMQADGFAQLDDATHGIEYKATSITDITGHIQSDSFTPCPFRIWTTNEYWAQRPAIEDGYLPIKEPRSARAFLLGDSDSVKALWQCEFIFDNWTIHISKTAGFDRGVSIVYGKDMLDVTQEENISEMITGVLPYYYADMKDPDNQFPSAVAAGVKDYITGSILRAEGTFERENIAPLNLTGYFTEKSQSWTHCDTDVPTPEDLDYVAGLWAQYNELGIPEVSLTVDYAQLGQTVYMYDAIHVFFERLGIDVTAQVSGCTYDVLAERYTSIDIGRSKASLMWKGLMAEGKLNVGFIPGVEY